MAGRGSKAHIHKYHQIEIAGIKVFACALSDCTHYMPNHMRRVVKGKASMCWECNKEFNMDDESMLMERPTCLDCRHPELKHNPSEDLEFERALAEMRRKNLIG